MFIDTSVVVENHKKTVLLKPVIFAYLLVPMLRSGFAVAAAAAVTVERTAVAERNFAGVDCYTSHEVTASNEPLDLLCAVALLLDAGRSRMGNSADFDIAHAAAAVEGTYESVPCGYEDVAVASLRTSYLPCSNRCSAAVMLRTATLGHCRDRLQAGPDRPRGLSRRRTALVYSRCLFACSLFVPAICNRRLSPPFPQMRHT